MNDFFEKYYTGKKFPTNRKNPFINGARSKPIFDDRNNIYMSYQPIFTLLLIIIRVFMKIIFISVQISTTMIMNIILIIIVFKIIECIP